ncbi:predicted protein [Sclerotinia sclerotiorum 1980 UF-70]|uniref:Uncharacterized protein n=1 Tax=Sclerotinia sclerotiorum (strain ATCC 18683 / 1980 / Ss-1) TaxID=665079 RepID=A7EGG6_SCLS1|nr:predicted protein [Sclerotinia sclerotiorum 1980 UF-70]EDO01932.1 predicted protein [Sclerotinia sclerotiorum 1980 UF-70]
MVYRRRTCYTFGMHIRGCIQEWICCEHSILGAGVYGNVRTPHNGFPKASFPGLGTSPTDLIND